MSQLYTVEKTIDDAMDAMADAIQPFCINSEIIRAEQDRVAMPVGEFVVLNDILTASLATSQKTNAQSGISATITESKRFDIQIDFYGPSAADQCRAFSGVFKSEHFVGLLPDWIKPLYISDPVSAPLTNGEQQYQHRWIVTASMQFNTVITVPIQTASTIGLNVFEEINSGAL